MSEYTLYIVVLYRLGPTSYFGPFADYRIAQDWNETNLRGRGQIVDLFQPDLEVNNDHRAAVGLEVGRP